MNVIRTTKQIKSDYIHIDGLEKFKGENAEIIILIEDSLSSDAELRREKANKLIDSYSGKVMKWTREDIHER